MLFDTLSALRDGRTGLAEAGVDLSALNGVDIDVAIQTIVQALTPADGDADRIMVAMTMALSESLEGMDDFDSSSITDDMLVSLMLAYVRNCVFDQILLDSRDAFAKAIEGGRGEQAENDLEELINASVDKHMRPLLSTQIRSLNRLQVEAVQLRALADVWLEWEAYEL